MRLQQLTIHNLASIEDATLDFEQPPLAESDVFLITGKTGAGKSTILDAICLALYGATPRLKNNLMEGKLQKEDDELAPDDARILMRRQTTEAYVRLTFVGRNGVTYQAVWAVRRARPTRKHPQGKLQAAEHSLTFLREGVSVTLVKREPAFRTEIMQAVGLDFDQFCRTTLLAQGEFTRFLNSKDREKSAILEKITGTDYTAIGQHIYEKTHEKREAKEAAEQACDHVVVLTDEERQQHQADIARCQEEEQAVQASLHDNAAQQAWLKRNLELTEQHAAAEKDLQAQTDALATERFQQEERTVALWHETIAVRLALQQRTQCEQRQKELQQSLNKAKDDVLLLMGKEQRLQALYNEQAAELQRLEGKISLASPRAKFYEQTAQWVTLLHSLADGQQLVQQENDAQECLEQTLQQRLTPQYEAAKQRHELAKKTLDTLRAEIVSADEALQALGLDTLREEEKRLNNLQRDLALVLTHLTHWEEAVERLHTLEQQVQADTNTLQRYKDEWGKLQKQAETAATRAETRREVMEQQQATVHDYAQHLRARLRVGEVCPVCQQRVTTLPAEEGVLRALFEQSRQAYEAAQKEAQRLQQQRDERGGQCRALQDTLQHLRTDLTQQQQTCAAKCAEWQRASQACGLEEDEAPAVKAAVAQQQALLSDRLTRLAHSLQEGKKREQDLALQRKQEPKCIAACEREQQAVEAAQKEMEDAVKQQQTSAARCEQKQREMAEWESTLATHIPQELNLAIDWRVSPREWAAALQCKADSYQQALKQRDTMSHDLAQQQDGLSALHDDLTALVALLSLPEGAYNA